MPIAYKDAELHRMEVRVGKTIDRYLEALSIWGLEITPQVERDMTQHFALLTSGPSTINFPPGLRHDMSTHAVQGSFSRERSRLANKLVRQGSNRLRELKARMNQERKTAENRQTQGHGNTYVVQGSNNTVGSTVDQSIRNVCYTSHIQDLVDSSRVDPRLEALAGEIETESKSGKPVVEKLQQWAALANSTIGFAEKMHQHYPTLHAWLQTLGVV